MPTQPYREPPPTNESKAPDTLLCQWIDGERQATPVGLYYGFAASVMAAALLWHLSAVASGLVVLGGAVGAWRYLRRVFDPVPLKLSVSNGTLFIEGPAGPMVTLPVDSVREVELDSKAIQRVTYHQNVGAALPSTNVSGDVDLSRIVFVQEDGTRVWLTDTYASYSECMVRFGKVRVFLRAHGWLPHDEREKAQR